MTPAALKNLESKMPSGAFVTWADFRMLCEMAEKVHVCFYVLSSKACEREAIVGRALEIPKSLGIAYVDRFLDPHSSGESVYVFACAGNLYFGAR